MALRGQYVRTLFIQHPANSGLVNKLVTLASKLELNEIDESCLMCSLLTLFVFLVPVRYDV
jgi:hypothetical protein